MAFIINQVGKTMFNNTIQSLANDKKMNAAILGLIRDNTKRCWRPALGAVIMGTCVYGAIKIRSEILLARKELDIRPTLHEVRNLAHTARLADSNCGPELLDLEKLDGLVDDMFEELLEFEDYLEVDQAPEPAMKWEDTDRRIEISETLDTKCCDADSVEAKAETRRAVAEIKQRKVNYEEFRRARKRVRSGQLSKACKSLAAKLRASFPIPDGSSLQQKAMCLYAAKECRKLHLRESQIAQIIPQAVSLASVPSTDQINMRMLTKIEPVQLKYNKMAWSGYQSKQSWLAKLLPMLA